MNLKVLVVDDDPQSLESTKRILEHAGYEVLSAASGPLALNLLKQKPQLIVTDVRMPGMTGIEFVEAYQKMGFEIPFVVMTAFGQVQDAVWAMKMGAVDFLLKPFKRQALCDAVEQVSKRVQSRTSLKADSSTTTSLVGSSRAMKELKVLIEQVAKTDASVLILGESGTGKERVAKLVHEFSNRKDRPFVAVNCAAIPENLLESELFGFEKGAFSGAESAKKGLLESAEGGTLLLDEIGDMPLSLQPKLLRVLEEQKVRRLGSTQEKSVNVRILAATHRDLHQKVKEGKFRQDLFYRLDVITLPLSPLRNRSEDIAELTQFFLKKYSAEYSKDIAGIDTEAQASLLEHEWPGNVRELSNVLERAVILCDEKAIHRKHLPAHFQLMEAVTHSSRDDQKITIPLGMSLKEIENLMIQKALAVTQGDRGQAAKLLGVNERTIYRRISKTKED